MQYSVLVLTPWFIVGAQKNEAIIIGVIANDTNGNHWFFRVVGIEMFTTFLCMAWCFHLTTMKM